MRADGLLFDKDGTLFDFATSWNAWAGDMISGLSEGDGALALRLAEALEDDLARDAFHPHSFVIAGTNRGAAEAIASVLPDRPVQELEVYLMEAAATATLAEAVPLSPFLGELKAQGLKLGVMTNDTEYAARAQLRASGVEEEFHFIAGFDSGFGAKPAPDPLLAFARHMQLASDRVVMVGDSTHDLIAGRAAGMQTVAVLTGMAGQDELAPYADVVFPDIGHIPAWLFTVP